MQSRLRSSPGHDFWQGLRSNSLQALRPPRPYFEAVDEPFEPQAALLPEARGTTTLAQPPT